MEDTISRAEALAYIDKFVKDAEESKHRLMLWPGHRTGRLMAYAHIRAAIAALPAQTGWRG